jgi:histidinol-phosphate aminotransferase
VPLTDDFAYDAGAWCDAIATHRPELCVLCLPNNPTGTELETPSVRRIIEAAAAHGGMVVIDEAYREFSSAELDRTSLVLEHDNVLLLRTFSKAFSAAGARLGYAITNAEIGSELRRMVPPFHVSVFHAVLGLVLFRRKSQFQKTTRELVRSRDEMMVEVGSLPGVRVYPSCANFFLARFSDADRVFDGLAERGVLVRKPGGRLRDCLRINAGTPDENDRFLAALREILGEAR